MAKSMHEKMMRLHGANGEMKPGHTGASMKKASFEVALKDKKQIAEGTYAFTFEKPKNFKFRAGQHIRMTLINPPETDSEGGSRFLSLACTPQDENLVVALRMRDTAFKRVLGNMQVGEKVLIQILLGVPHGAFAMHDDASKPAVFVVGGIGIVPAYSMIKDASERNLPHKMFLFYSNRRPEDAPFLSELQQLAKQNPNFKLVATMTEVEKSVRDWQGETEYINKAMIGKYLGDVKSPVYYVSGLPAMVSAMREMLTDSGVGKENIKAEEFTGFNLNDLNNTNRVKKGVATLVALAVALILLIAAVGTHVAGAQSALESLSFTNPWTYLIIALLLIIVAVKFKLLLFLKRRRDNERGSTESE